MFFKKKRYIINFVPGCVDIYKDIKCTKFVSRYIYYWFWKEVFLKDGIIYIPLAERGVLYYDKS